MFLRERRKALGVNAASYSSQQQHCTSTHASQKRAGRAQPISSGERHLPSANFKFQAGKPHLCPPILQLKRPPPPPSKCSCNMARLKGFQEKDRPGERKHPLHATLECLNLLSFLKPTGIRSSPAASPQLPILGPLTSSSPASQAPRSRISH